ncbi:MAG: hypothetical protein WCT77_12300 [Bacteroidota bacterium]
MELKCELVNDMLNFLGEIPYFLPSPIEGDLLPVSGVTTFQATTNGFKVSFNKDVLQCNKKGIYNMVKS